LLDVLLERGNPFEEDSVDLVTLDNEVCINVFAATSVHILEFTGQEQFDSIRKNVFDSNEVLLTAPIKRNNLLLFKTPKTVTKIALKRIIQNFKQHAELYGQPFIALDSRGGNLEEFFHHESSSSLPAFSSEGSLNSS